MRLRRLRAAERVASWVLAGVVASCAGAKPAPPAAPAMTVSEPVEGVRARLRAQIEGAGAPLGPFYAARDFQPVWVGDTVVSRAGADLLAAIAAAADDGLDPRAYDLAAPRALLDSPPQPDVLARLDVLLSSLWFSWARDFATGRVAPAQVDTMWSPTEPIDLAGALATAVGAGETGSGLGAAVDQLRPPHAGYSRLRRALLRYRDIEGHGGWDNIGPGRPLGRGMRDPRVAALRRRLTASGDLDVLPAARSDSFDASLEAAVRRFQARHGLAADGRVAALTLSALNVPVTARVRQIELNLERWRWLPRSLGARYVMVNAAGFAVEAVERDSVVVRARAIAGRPEWPTPLVSGSLTHVVLHPAWHVPRDIARLEVLPAVRRDSGYLAREGMRVYTAEGWHVVDPDTVDWTTVPDTALPCRFVQAPGPRNPLGRVKLVFANPFGVALHDTPDPTLFQPSARAFSHGCVRIEDAADLAVYLLRDSPGWSRDSILKAAAPASERWIRVAQPVPVHLAYWTAWVAADGRVEFRDDVYGWDRKLEQALVGGRTGASGGQSR